MKYTLAERSEARKHANIIVTSKKESEIENYIKFYVNNKKVAKRIREIFENGEE